MNWRLFLPKTVTVLQQGYRFADFRADLIAGLTVAIVALPLAMALAIASGTTPEKGLITAVVAGFLISLLGGSRFQIGGPTGAFVVIVYGVIARHGYDGLLLATLMAGAILIVAGLARLGTLIKYIPDPVTTGFTSGIAIVIVTSQVADLLGLELPSAPAELGPKLAALWEARSSLDPVTTGLSAVCLVAILVLRRWAPRWPVFLFVTVGAAAAVQLLGLPVETIGSRFGGFSAALEPVRLTFDWSKAPAVLPSALTIAMLAGIESLLSAVVADQMTGRRHRSNAELVAQGIANMASAAFGGMPATGAIARTATNIRAQARSPVAGMAHAVFLFLFMATLAPLLALAPLAALATVLVAVAWNMAEIPRFRLLLGASPGDRAVLLTTFALTVVVDLTVAISVGMVLASFVFMHRMSRLVAVETGEQLFQQDAEDGRRDRPAYAPNFGLPDDIGVVTFRGPLFFAGATVLKDALEQVGSRKRCFILRFEDVPMVDPTGAHALEAFTRNALRDGEVYIAGASPAVADALRGSMGQTLTDRVCFTRDFSEASQRALAGLGGGQPEPV